jgi:hypothetical protein
MIAPNNKEIWDLPCIAQIVGFWSWKERVGSISGMTGLCSWKRIFRITITWFLCSLTWFLFLFSSPFNHTSQAWKLSISKWLFCLLFDCPMMSFSWRRVVGLWATYFLLFLRNMFKLVCIVLVFITVSLFGPVHGQPVICNCNVTECFRNDSCASVCCTNCSQPINCTALEDNEQ